MYDKIHYKLKKKKIKKKKTIALTTWTSLGKVMSLFIHRLKPYSSM